MNIQYIQTEWYLWLSKVSLSEMEEEMLLKIDFVADYEGRGVNSHILVLIRENIKAFKAANGKIEGGISPDGNGKTTGK